MIKKCILFGMLMFAAACQTVQHKPDCDQLKSAQKEQCEQNAQLRQRVPVYTTIPR